MTTQTAWCPYTDKHLLLDQTSPEHIVPLSLGGSNSFEIPVCRNFNSGTAAMIDAKMANEFGVLFRRSAFDARGHSKAPPTPTLHHGRLGDGRPVQIRFVKNEGVQVFDPRQRRVLKEKELEGLSLTGKFSIERNTRMKFMCKAALSAGHFVYGDYFRASFDHGLLRTVMNLKKDEDIDPDCKLRLYDEFSVNDEEDTEQTAISARFCKDTAGSCLHFLPGEKSVGIVFGILGQWIGTLNVPARTDGFDWIGGHDLGHAVLLEGGTLRQLSYRQLAREHLARFGKDNA
ncbi:HNH endonuclease [Xanthomonas phaseoli]|uniref:HNH endonuclease n=1 Tax=Xanthomonas phaseoli TaxID=1985254 RepID=UPI001E618C63|nr:HNH endonuclease [Xanthomonas phaseoli]MCC8531914.1 HNH endonuclease [Xanthomonas phaseoli]